jgi:hypothetical protein
LVLQPPTSLLGADISQVSHVINFDLPVDADSHSSDRPHGPGGPRAWRFRLRSRRAAATGYPTGDAADAAIGHLANMPAGRTDGLVWQEVTLAGQRFPRRETPPGRRVFGRP